MNHIISCIKWFWSRPGPARAETPRPACVWAAGAAWLTRQGSCTRYPWQDKQAVLNRFDISFGSSASSTLDRGRRGRGSESSREMNDSEYLAALSNEIQELAEQVMTLYQIKMLIADWKNVDSLLHLPQARKWSKLDLAGEPPASSRPLTPTRRLLPPRRTLEACMEAEKFSHRSTLFFIFRFLQQPWAAPQISWRISKAICEMYLRIQILPRPRLDFCRFFYPVCGKASLFRSCTHL